MQREHLTVKELRIKLGMRLYKIRRVLEGKVKMNLDELTALIDNYPYLKGKIEIGDM
jgi:hypothetical protein